MDPRELKEKAAQLAARGKFDKARDLYAQLIPLMPAEPQLRVRYAELCRKTGAPDRALEAYVDAAEMLLAHALYARARAALSMAAALNPKHPRVIQVLRKLAAEDVVSQGAQTKAVGNAGSSARTSVLEVKVGRVRAEDLASQSLPGPESLPLMKRLSAHAVAYRFTPTSKWLVFTSETPIHVEERDEVEHDELASDIEIPLELASPPKARA